MSAPVRAVLFGVLLAAVFGVSMLAGSAWGPTLDPAPAADHGGAGVHGTELHPGTGGVIRTADLRVEATR